MKQEDIIRMAREAGLHLATDVNWMPIINLAYAEKFAALVEEAATEAANARATSSWTLMCKKMVAFENEACAKVCERYWSSALGSDGAARAIAAAIRARGQA